MFSDKQDIRIHFRKIIQGTFLPELLPPQLHLIQGIKINNSPSVIRILPIHFYCLENKSKILWHDKDTKKRYPVLRDRALSFEMDKSSFQTNLWSMFIRFLCFGLSVTRTDRLCKLFLFFITFHDSGTISHATFCDSEPSSFWPFAHCSQNTLPPSQWNVGLHTFSDFLISCQI